MPKSNRDLCNHSHKKIFLYLKIFNNSKHYNHNYSINNSKYLLKEILDIHKKKSKMSINNNKDNKEMNNNKWRINRLLCFGNINSIQFWKDSNLFIKKLMDLELTLDIWMSNFALSILNKNGMKQKIIMKIILNSNWSLI